MPLSPALKRYKSLLWLLAPLAVAAILFVWPWAQGLADGAAPAPAFPQDTMVIERADGKTLPFKIEVATTPEQHAYGLMYRRHLDTDAGMIFLWETPQQVAMWMKNTYIPLDMLYVAADGRIRNIIAHAEPLNLTPLPSDGPVKAVIELAGGAVDAYGLKTGDRVVYKAFNP
ncbi:MAG: DUF192 domain-containing protein [Alphaproteobacteria bacterium]|nr:DUF192 domain-containing protein [Alphaproteobacteria bacterium]